MDEARIREILNEFIGKITQLPPVRSSVKRQLRERSVYYIDVLEIEGQDILIKVGCEAGTYIRKLCHDVGTLFQVRKTKLRLLLHLLFD